MLQSSEAPAVRHGRARLVVLINGRAYHARRVPPPTGRSRKRRWSLISDRGRRYLCWHGESGYLHCSCPDQAYNHAACKHLRALQALGLLPARVTVMPPPVPAIAEVAR